MLTRERFAALPDGRRRLITSFNLRDLDRAVEGAKAAGIDPVVTIENNTIVIGPKSVGARESPAPARCALYRHYDRDRRLRYVGISVHPVRRLRQHELGAHWYGSIAHIEIEWFDTRTETEAAKTAAILAENPLHNIARRAAAG
jgi:hypothetical protein